MEQYVNLGYPAKKEADVVLPLTGKAVPDRAAFPGRPVALLRWDPMPLDKSTIRVRRMFGEVAGRYDLLNHLLSMNVDRYWRWRAVRATPPTSGGPVLDVCTGTGDLALAYCRSWRRTVRGRDRGVGGRTPSAAGAGHNPGGVKPPLVVATDFCSEMLRLGQRKGRRARTGDQLAFVEADTLCLPFPDAHFQVVAVAFGLRNVADPARGLAEMARVCAPRGRVVVLEFSLPSSWPLRAVYGWYFAKVLPRIGRLVSAERSNAYNYLPASVHEFPFGQALADQMRAAGLVSVTVQPLTFGIVTLYIGQK